MADARFNDSEAPLIPGTGHSLYVIHWHSLHQAKHREWLQERSRSRRWAVGNGDEWKTLGAAPSITDGARVLRLLCNALPSRARWRPSSQRRSHQCATCGNGEFQMVWRSPSPSEAVPNDTGIAWCHDCVRPGSSDNLWSNLPDTMLLVALRGHAAECRGQSFRMNFDHGPSVYGACPLCGYGEAGAEHIWHWCPAVVMAWRRVGDGTSWSAALSGMVRDVDRLAITVSQVVFLHTSLFGRTAITATEAAGRIDRAVRASVGSNETLGDPDTEEEVYAPSAIEVGNWSTVGECIRCRASGRALCYTGRAERNRRDECGCAEPNAHRHKATARAPCDVGAGRVIASLRTHTVPARWMLASSEWWPPPWATGGANPNCAWHSRRCEQCGRHGARLIATTHVPRDCEITVPRSLTPLCGATLYPFEIFFDGGIDSRGDFPASGAAALLWRIHSFGPPTCIARAVMAIPEQGLAPLAESHVCGLALRLLASLTREHRDSNRGPLRARTIGDCIPVVRYGAAQARFRVLSQRAPIDDGLDEVLRLGWTLEWQAVGRQHNLCAHVLAQHASGWATEFRHAGSLHIQTRSLCRNIATDLDADFPLPPWPYVGLRVWVSAPCLLRDLSCPVLSSAALSPLLVAVCCAWVPGLVLRFVFPFCLLGPCPSACLVLIDIARPLKPRPKMYWLCGDPSQDPPAHGHRPLAC